MPDLLAAVFPLPEADPWDAASASARHREHAWCSHALPVPLKGARQGNRKSIIQRESTLFAGIPARTTPTAHAASDWKCRHAHSIRFPRPSREGNLWSVHRLRGYNVPAASVVFNDIENHKSAREHHCRQGHGEGYSHRMPHSLDTSVSRRSLISLCRLMLARRNRVNSD